MGVLLGSTTKDLHNIELVTCFGIPNEQDFTEILASHKKVHPDLTEIGFYSNSEDLLKDKIGLLLLFGNDETIQLFEYQNNKKTLIEWQFTATDEERIGVHHLILNESSDSLASFLTNIQNAVSVLNSRVSILAEYVSLVNQGFPC